MKEKERKELCFLILVYVIEVVEQSVQL